MRDTARGTGTVRYAIGSVLVLLGAVAAVWSAFRPWYNGRDGRYYGVDDLVTGITETNAQVMGSIFLPMAVAALLAVLGILRRSRLLTVIAGLLILGTTLLWMVRQAEVSDGLAIDADGSGLDVGVANAFAAVLLTLAGAAVMGRRRRFQARHRKGDPLPRRPEAGPKPGEPGTEQLPGTIYPLPGTAHRSAPGGEPHDERDERDQPRYGDEPPRRDAA